MLNKSDFVLLMQESWARFWTKSPKYFRVWGWINMTISAIGIIPDFIKLCGIVEPPLWILISGKVMIGIGLWGKINNKMVVALPENPVLADKVKAKIMPFTEKKNREKTAA